MSSIDDRIVNMQFNNKQFISGASDSQKALEGLERTVANTAKSKGLDDLGRNVEATTSRFGALQIAGVSALATIASKATTAGINLLKSLTIDPIMQGFNEYELNLKSIQTVVANTGLGVGEVGKYMQQLNKYSDQTVYNFSQMAQNIGRFTAAGVEVSAATDAIKGMANAAALAGADTNQLNSAMYQMSQALSSGTIRLMDWNSLVNANMGGQNIQQALMDTARTVPEWSAAMEAATAGGVAFRDSLQAGWLEADIYTKTMKVMAGQIEKGTGDTIAFSVAQLEAMGYTKKAAIELNELSANAIESATKIKTVSQLIEVVQESVGSGFARLFRGLFGGLNKASTLWTGVGEKITGATDAMFTSLAQVLRGWRQAGGYTALWEGLGNIFQSIGNLLKPFVALFQAIFPATQDVGGGLADATKGFASVTGWIEKLTANTSYLIPAFTKAGEMIRWFFGQLGTIISIGAKVTQVVGGLAAQGAAIAENLIGGIIGGLDPRPLLDKVVGLANDIVSWIENALGIASPAKELIPVGKNIVLGIAQGIGDGIIFIIENLGIILPKLIAFGGEVVAALSIAILQGVTALFTTVLDVIDKVAPKLGEALSTIGGASADSLTAAGKETGSVWESIGEVFAFVGGIIKKVFGGLGNVISDVIGKFFSLFSSGGGIGSAAMGFATLINAVLIGGILFAIRKFINGMSQLFNIAGSLSNFFDSVSGALDDFGTSLKQQAHAEVIKAYAVALAILTASLIALSFIDPVNLGKGLGAIAGMMTLLVGSMKVLTGLDGGAKAIIAMGIAMNLMATAILILSGAIAILGSMDWQTLAQGLGGVAAGLILMIGAMFLMNKLGGKAVLAMAASMLIMAVALNAVATAVLMFGSMDMNTLVQGLAGMAAALAIMVGAMFLFEKFGGKLEGMAASMLVMAIALNALAVAIGVMGSMDVATLAKGLGAMALALGILILAMAGFSKIKGSIEGFAASLLVMSVAIGVLAVALGILGSMDYETLAKGLGAMALALGILLLAALGAQQVALGLGVLSSAVLLLGVAMLAAGAGFFLFATGLSILVTLGAAGIAIMTSAILAFIALLPQIAVQVGAAFVAFVQTIAAASGPLREAFGKIFEDMIGTITDAMPVIGGFFTKLIDTLLDVVTDAVPKFGELLELMIKTGIEVLRASIPRWVELGFTLIDRFLKSAEKHVPEIAGSAADIVRKFIEKITEKLPGIIRAGTDLIIAFIEGVGKNALRIANATARTIITFLAGLRDAIKKYSKQFREIGAEIAFEIADGMTLGLLGKGMDMVTDAAAQLGIGAGDAVKKEMEIESPSKVFMRLGINLGEGLAEGILKSTAVAVLAAAKMANAVITAGESAISRVQNKATKAQGIAFSKDAVADIAERNAKQADKEAAEYAKKNKKDKEGIKRREKEAAELNKLAAKMRKEADAAQKALEAANQRVADAQAFEEADLTGKGDIKNDRAVLLAERAQQMLAKANAEAAEAKRLMKVSKEAGQAMLKQAQKDAKQARALAAQAKAANREANRYYQQELAARIRSLREAAAADAADLAFDAADESTQASMLAQRAFDNEAKAQAAQARSNALIAQAQAVAKKDGAKALRLMAQAEAAADEARQAASDARSQREQAQSILQNIAQEAQSAREASQAEQETDEPETPSVESPGSITLSRSILEDAASTIDRYTASLQQASDLAAAQQGTIQFTQNNYSPEALSASEIYRQNQNLLSAAEIKMGANANTGP